MTTEADPALQDPTFQEQLWWLPLILSGLAIFVSFIALAWQVRAFLLTGARVHLRLTAAVWYPGFMIRQGESRSGAMPPSDQPEYGNVGVECAVLTVENRGRTAVTVSSAGLAYRGERTRRYGLRRSLRRQLHTLSPRMFASRELGNETSAKPIRIEPYSSVQYLLDVHTAIAAAREYRTGRLRLRGHVDQAGRRRNVVSRRAWSIPKDAQTIVGFGPQMPVERRVMLELARNGDTYVGHGDAEYCARVVAARLADLRRTGEFDVARARQLVEGALTAWLTLYGDEHPIVGLAALNLVTDLESHPERFDWSGAEEDLDRLGTAFHWEKRSEPDDARQQPDPTPDDRAGTGLRDRVLPEDDASAGQGDQDDEGGQADGGNPPQQ